MTWLVLAVLCLSGCDQLFQLDHVRPSRDALAADTSEMDAEVDASLDVHLLARFELDASYTSSAAGGGTATCAPSCPTFVGGKHAQGAQFAGTDQCLAFPLPALAASFTVMAWVYRHNDTSYALIAKPYLGGALDTFLLDTDSNNTLRAWSTDGGSQDVVTAPASLLLDNFQHIALTYDGTTKKLYVGGTLRATEAKSVAIDPSHDMLMGCESNSGALARFLGEGILDDIRVYDIALSAGDIAGIYQAN